MLYEGLRLSLRLGLGLPADSVSIAGGKTLTALLNSGS
jgi:hypothetical protein